MKKGIPLNLQFFAEGGNGGDENQSGQQSQQTGQQSPAFDYEKLANIVNGKQSVTEDNVLKSYFAKQGLSESEMTQAISAFKEQKAKNTPDIAAIQTQLAQEQKARNEAVIEKEAIMQGLSLGLDVKSIPYVIKLADMSNVVDKEGKINAESVKAALSKVLEDLPQLKPTEKQASTGFRVGNTQGNADEAKATEEKLRNIFGLKNN